MATSTVYPITDTAFVYDADGIASIRQADGSSLYLNSEAVDALVDALQSVQVDRERRQESRAQMDTLDVSKVSAVYSGKRGCECGCRGNHSSTSRSIQTVIRKMREAAGDGCPVVIITDTYYAVETATRSYIAYIDGRVA
jgi:hypothetical protein